MNQSRLNDIVAEADAMICSFGLVLPPRPTGHLRNFKRFGRCSGSD